MGKGRVEVPPGAQPLAGGQRAFSPWDIFIYCVGILVFPALVAFSHGLVPSPSGKGTHTQLNLPPCGVYLLFGKPCPSCGMTTSFALLSRGEFKKALKCQPAGVALFAALLALWAYLPFALFRRSPIEHIFELKAFLPTTIFLILTILANWLHNLAG